MRDPAWLRFCQPWADFAEIGLTKRSPTQMTIVVEDPDVGEVGQHFVCIARCVNQ
jgi:hypothetical protein